MPAKVRRTCFGRLVVDVRQRVRGKVDADVRKRVPFKHFYNFKKYSLPNTRRNKVEQNHNDLARRSSTSEKHLHLINDNRISLRIFY